MAEGIISMSGGEEERGDSILDTTLESLGEDSGRGATFSDEEEGGLGKLVGSAAGKVKGPGMLGVGEAMAGRGRGVEGRGSISRGGAVVGRMVQVRGAGGAGSRRREEMLSMIDEEREVACVVCGQQLNGQVDFHMFALHVPWFVKPDTACWTCRRQFLTPEGLREHWREVGHAHREQGEFVSGENLEQWGELMKMLLEGLAGIHGLTGYVEMANFIKRKLAGWNLGVDMSGTHYRRLFRVYVDFVGAQELGYEWAGICHWGRVAVLLNREGKGRQFVEEVGNLLRRTSEWKGQSEQANMWEGRKRSFGTRNIGVADAHCHLDRVLRRITAPRGGNFCEKWEELDSKKKNVGVELKTVVTSLCWPEEWGNINYFGEMVREGINLFWTVGVHPKVRFEQRMEEKWERMIRSDRCVGVGEVGWDKEGDLTQEQSLRTGFVWRLNIIRHW